MNYGFSIIVCCYNSANLLPETLKQLAALDITIDLPVELLIVDNASKDNTAAAAENIWKTLGEPYNLHIIYEQTPGLSFARAAGIREAKYEYLVFCDDDNWLSRNYLIEAKTTLEADSCIGILGGCGEGVSDIKIPEWTNAFQLFGSGKQAAENGQAYALYGAGVVIRKTVFGHLTNAGFYFHLTDRKEDQLSSGGDYELCYAIQMAGYKAWYNEDMRFRHHIHPLRLTFRYYKKYVRESAYSNDILSIYSLLLFHTKVSFTYYFFRQLWQVLHHIKYTVLLGSKLQMRKIKGDKNTFPLFISFYYHYTRMFQVIRFIPKSKKHFSAIKKMKKNLQQENMKVNITVPEII